MIGRCAQSQGLPASVLPLHPPTWLADLALRQQAMAQQPLRWALKDYAATAWQQAEAVRYWYGAIANMMFHTCRFVFWKLPGLCLAGLLLLGLLIIAYFITHPRALAHVTVLVLKLVPGLVASYAEELLELLVDELPWLSKFRSSTSNTHCSYDPRQAADSVNAELVQSLKSTLNSTTMNNTQNITFVLHPPPPTSSSSSAIVAWKITASLAAWLTSQKMGWVGQPWSGFSLD